MLSERGIKPEELPPAEDIKKLERKVKKQKKTISDQAGKLPQQKIVVDKETEEDV